MWVANEIKNIPLLSCNKPEGAFYAWVDIGQTGLSSRDVARRLLEEEQLVTVPGGSFGTQTDNYIRITCVRRWDELAEGLSRLRSFTNSLR